MPKTGKKGTGDLERTTGFSGQKVITPYMQGFHPGKGPHGYSPTKYGAEGRKRAEEDERKRKLKKIYDKSKHT